MAEDQFRAPTKADMRRSQSRPDNRPESYESQDHTVSERRFQGVKQVKSAASTIRSASAPDFHKPTGALLALLALNFGWSVWRATVNNPDHVKSTVMKSAAGLWFVGLVVLVVAEFNPQIAVLFMVLLTLGNVLKDNAANTKALSFVNQLFVGKVGA